MITNSEEFCHCGGLSDCETFSRAGLCLPDRRRVKKQNHCKTEDCVTGIERRGFAICNDLIELATSRNE